ELAEAGLTPDGIAARLGMPPWLVAKSVGRGRAVELARALGVLRRLDLELKSARPAEAVVDAAPLEIAGPRAPAPAPSPCRRPGRGATPCERRCSGGARPW